jgi:hypothetical protein
MLRGHIACQQGGQVACPFRNKCRDRVAQRPYVRLCPLAYVTGNKPRGSIGSLPERGAQVHRIRPGHVAVLDPCLHLGIPCPGTSLWPGPYSGVPGHIEGPGRAYRGPVLPRGGPVQLVHPVMYHLFSPRSAPWATHVVGSGVVHRAARERHTGTASSYCSKEYP